MSKKSSFKKLVSGDSLLQQLGLNGPTTGAGTLAASEGLIRAGTTQALAAAGPGNDSLVGTSGADTLQGLDGNDTLKGAGGSDLLEGGNGNDQAFGGIGADTLAGDNGSDTLDGGTGNDSIAGGADADRLLGNIGDDRLAGDNGNDTIDGGTGADLALGGEGQDSLLGGIGADTLEGGNGNDTLKGESGADSLLGGGGNDLLEGGDHGDSLDGGAGNDTVQGQGGNDSVAGGDGNDSLNGGANDDTIVAGNGNDSLVGGSGFDVVKFSGFTDDYLVVAGPGYTIVTDLNTADGDDGTDTLFGVEELDMKENPIADDFMTGGKEDQVLSVTLTGSDPDGTVVRVFLTSLPTDGTLYTDMAAMTNPITSLPADFMGSSVTLYFRPNPSFIGNATFQFSVEDNEGGIDNSPATVTLAYSNADQDPPALELDARPIGATGCDIPLDLSVALKDPDGTLDSATVTISGGLEVGDLLQVLTPGGLTVNYNAMTGELTLTGPGSVADFRTALESIRFSATDAGMGTRTFTYEVDDGVNPPVSDMLTLTLLEQLVELINLDVPGTYGHFFSVTGPFSEDRVGENIASAGDFNGDGYDDLIMGARHFGGPSTLTQPGAAFVVFAPTGGFTADFDLTTLNGSNGFRFDGLAGNDFTGRDVASLGDINNDGFDDIIIGANVANTPAHNDAGRAYIVFGSASGFPAVIDQGDLDGTLGFQILGTASFRQLGYDVSGVGDVNGDGIDDFAVGIAGAIVNLPTPTAIGAVMIVYGHEGAWAPSFDPTTINGSNGFILRGFNIPNTSGDAVTNVGDVNGDGIDDIFMGSSRINNPQLTGGGFLVFGTTAARPATFDLSTINGVNGVRFTGENPIDFLGLSTRGAGDINGDGLADFIISAPGHDQGSMADERIGRSYVIFGKSSGWTTNFNFASLDGTNGFIVNGLLPGDFASQSITGIGDFNGDGYDDFAVAILARDVGAILNAGAVYVVYGAPSGWSSSFDLTTLDGTNGFVVIGDNSDMFNFGDVVGADVSAAGDVNGDGFADIAIASREGSVHAGSDIGETFIVYGNAYGCATVQAGTTGDDSLEGSLSDEALVGGRGNDTLMGRGGEDALSGGHGDDFLSVGDLDFQRIDGGAGNDLLALDGAGLHLNLTTLGDEIIRGIERIDLSGTGNNTLTLSLLDVFQISDNANTLQIDGNMGDVLHFGAGWTASGTQMVGMETYNVFTQGEAVLLVDQLITAGV